MWPLLWVIFCGVMKSKGRKGQCLYNKIWIVTIDTKAGWVHWKRTSEKHCVNGLTAQLTSQVWAKAHWNHTQKARSISKTVKLSGKQVLEKMWFVLAKYLKRKVSCLYEPQQGILIPRAHDPSGLRQGSRVLTWSKTGSPRFSSHQIWHIWLAENMTQILCTYLETLVWPEPLIPATLARMILFDSCVHYSEVCCWLLWKGDVAGHICSGPFFLPD